MNIRNKDIMRCFPLLASVLGDKYGVEIRMGGDQAMTDGNIIYLPAMPAELDDETLAAAKGYIDHESAHVRYTDFEALQTAALGKLEQWLFNAIEDWRVEKKLTEIFPGCGQNFQRLIKRLFGGTTGAGRQNPALVALDYVLLSVRSWAVPEIAARKNQAGQILDGNFSGLSGALDELLVEVRQDCPSTEAAIAHARQLGACIRKYVNGGQNRQEANDDPEHEKRQHRAGHGRLDAQNAGGHRIAQTGGQSSSECEPEETGSNSPAQTDGERSDSVPAQGAGTVLLPETQGTGGSPDNPLDDLASLLAAENEDMPQNLGDMLLGRLKACAAKDDTEKVVMAVIGKKAVKAFSQEEKMEALRDSVALRQRLAGLLQARTLRQGGIGRHGKLDSPCLHRICVGNARVFRREAERIALDVAVHLLLDCSSSMDAVSMSMARKACYAIVKSLGNTKGVNLALTAFPTEHEDSGVYPVIRHGQSVKEIPSLDASGDTPLAPALWWVMREMLSLKESRKIVLILTDGVPNSVTATTKAIAQCQKLHMEVMGVGIQSNAVSYLLPKSSRVIWKLSELAPAMFELMQNALLKGGI